VVRGFDAWVVEYKNSRLRKSELRKDAAELDKRRRHLAGDGAVGILASVSKGDPDDPDVVSPLEGAKFELGRTLHLDQPLLVEAADAWLAGIGERSRLRDVFG